MQSYSELRKIQKSLLGSEAELSNLPYWPYRESHPACTTLMGLLPVGTFYLPFSTVGENEVALLRNEIRAVNSDSIIFVPHIRLYHQESVDNLRCLGFRLIDTEGESIVDAQCRSIDEYLREQVGSKTYRDHMRLVRRAEDYELLTFTVDEVNHRESLYKDWCNLFALHEAKYANGIIPYGKVLLDGLKNAECRHEYELNFRFHGDEVVQVYLTRVYRDSLFLIASAIKSNSVPSSVNLYTVMMMEVLTNSEKMGIRQVHLGRGGKDRKVKYGANRYLPHVHAVYTKNEAALLELDHRGYI